MSITRAERRRIERTKKKNPEKFQMGFELLQPWSTFMMKTQLPPEALKKMIKITDEILENRDSGKGDDVGESQNKDEFLIDLEILEREELMGGFLDACRTYIVQAYKQSEPFFKEQFLKEEWLLEMINMWIVSQKDNEYHPIHIHSTHLSAVMYLKIPEYLPNRKVYNNIREDGAITFIENVSGNHIWGVPSLMILPKVGDFFIFPSSQQHQVYPFRTADGKGERRSVSFNAVFASKNNSVINSKLSRFIE